MTARTEWLEIMSQWWMRMANFQSHIDHCRAKGPVPTITLDSWQAELDDYMSQWCAAWDKGMRCPQARVRQRRGYAYISLARVRSRIRTYT